MTNNCDVSVISNELKDLLVNRIKNDLSVDSDIQLQEEKIEKLETKMKELENEKLSMEIQLQYLSLPNFLETMNEESKQDKVNDLILLLSELVSGELSGEVSEESIDIIQTLVNDSTISISEPIFTSLVNILTLNDPAATINLFHNSPSNIPRNETNERTKKMDNGK
ncbi:hypothetical protein SNEBB_010896 [Seison nebaliae]|nr:hypothetical protein SNEBB_010896 [Seison nebaliae]